MFWPKPYNATFINERCRRKYGVQPRYDWISIQYGGLRGVAASSNVVFSNGLLDPWSAGGVTHTPAAAQEEGRTSALPPVEAVLIAEGAHHLDLMFSNQMDPPSVKTARKTELAHIRAWVDQAKRRQTRKA
jgi:lysosomal Pro-X carboxypeptidase